MPTYRVVWEIDIDADTPTEAAQKALKIQRKPDSWATVFQVIGEDESCQVDAMPEGPGHGADET
jgi:hypothetical protein